MKNKKFKKLDFCIIAQNKRAQFEYFIEEKIEAGLSLKGWEVKALRASKVNISKGYVIFREREAYLFGVTLTPIHGGPWHETCDPMRPRQLLLRKHELNHLISRVNRVGYTVVTLSIYWKNAWCKISIGLAKGKKEKDKRDNIKDREWRQSKDRIIKHANR